MTERRPLKAETYGLPPCLQIPVAAKSYESIQRYVGSITECSKSKKWAFVDFESAGDRNVLEVWAHPRSALLIQQRQCWVHVDYTGYRQIYQRCFPSVNLGKQVVDHIRNRRFARALGWDFVRLLHVDRSVNSSSGRGEEFDVINYKNPDGLKKFSDSMTEISYADPADLLKMLNIKVGAFPLNNLRDNLHLFYGRRNKS